MTRKKEDYVEKLHPAPPLIIKQEKSPMKS